MDMDEEDIITERNFVLTSLRHKDLGLHQVAR